MRLEGSVFLVTGGGSGLGAATVRGLLEAGANVVAADLKESDELASSQLGKSVRFVETDVTSEESVRGVIQTTTESFGPLRGVVNCAGVGVAEKVQSRKGLHDLDSFSRAVQVNLVGTFNVIRLAAEAMIEGGTTEEPDGERGVIVNTASVAAFDGQIGQAAYSASKGGVVSMTLPIARELARHGIRVATIAPGIFDTPMMAGLPEEARESLGKQVPFPQRLGSPQEYAALVRHIAENTMINGEVIRLDGSIRMGPT